MTEIADEIFQLASASSFMINEKLKNIFAELIAKQIADNDSYFPQSSRYRF